jgi:hypothetical protein
VGAHRGVEARMSLLRPTLFISHANSYESPLMDLFFSMVAYNIRKMCRGWSACLGWSRLHNMQACVEL